MVQNDLDDIYVDVNADDQDYERRLSIKYLLINFLDIEIN